MIDKDTFFGLYTYSSISNEYHIAHFMLWKGGNRVHVIFCYDELGQLGSL